MRNYCFPFSKDCPPLNNHIKHINGYFEVFSNDLQWCLDVTYPVTKTKVFTEKFIADPNVKRELEKFIFLHVLAVAAGDPELMTPIPQKNEINKIMNLNTIKSALQLKQSHNK